MTDLVDARGVTIAPGDTVDLGHVRCCQSTVSRGLCGQAEGVTGRLIGEGDPDACAVCLELIYTHWSECIRNGPTYLPPYPGSRHDTR
jgi:hypothetical protein